MNPILRQAAVLLCWLALCLPALAQTLPAPEDFRVTMADGKFSGRWKPVRGATHYEIWTKSFGGWRFDEKSFQMSPLTSSFELRVDNDRTRFKVRAVSSGGEKGKFSRAVSATRNSAESPDSAGGKSTRSYQKKQGPNIDLEAAAPGPPTGMLAVWSDPRVIRLVWQAPKEATKFSVEEFVNGKWVSVRELTFPKRTTALIKNHPMPGPYKFRVRSVGANGRASKPGRPTTARR